jgi:hypothetical protein
MSAEIAICVDATGYVSQSAARLREKWILTVKFSHCGRSQAKLLATAWVRRTASSITRILEHIYVQRAVGKALC